MDPFGWNCFHHSYIAMYQPSEFQRGNLTARTAYAGGTHTQGGSLFASLVGGKRIYIERFTLRFMNFFVTLLKLLCNGLVFQLVSCYLSVCYRNFHKKECLEAWCATTTPWARHWIPQAFCGCWTAGCRLVQADYGQLGHSEVVSLSMSRNSDVELKRSWKFVWLTGLHP